MVEIVFFILIAMISGFAAGLLGIGGGAIVVPGLVFSFKYFHFPLREVIHLAAGSSLAIMIFSAFSSSRSHMKAGHVNWQIFWSMAPALIVGTVVGSALGRSLHTDVLSLFFGVFLFFIGLKMLLHPKSKTAEGGSQYQHAPVLNGLLGFIIGMLGGMLGIGGGILSVPYLLSRKLPMQQATGVSAALTFPIAIVGSISFMLLGWHDTGVPHTTGFIYWPAVIVIAPVSMVTAWLGVKAEDVISPLFVRVLFSCLLLSLSVKMLWVVHW